MLALPLTLLAALALAAAAPAVPSAPPAAKPSATVDTTGTSVSALSAAPAAQPLDAADTTDSAASAPSAAPATAPAAEPSDTTDTTAPESSSAAGGGASSHLQLTFEAGSSEQNPSGELGAGEAMEGAENIVFKPLFRYRERGGYRRRVRESSRRRDALYRRTYAARFPHHRYRSSPKRRNALRVARQILF